MFAGLVSSKDTEKIRTHRGKFAPIYDKERDCGICLLEKNDGSGKALYKYENSVVLSLLD
jgi:hypothetical protein